MSTVEVEYLGDQVRLVERVPDVVQVATPAAGADWSIHVPNGELWDVLSIRGLLTASSQAANRAVNVIYTTGEVEYMRSAVGTLIVASKAAVVSFIADISAPVAVGLTYQGALPPHKSYVPGGHYIKSATEAIDAGDQWSAVAIYCHRIMEEVLSTDVIDTARPMDLLRKVRG